MRFIVHLASLFAAATLTGCGPSPKPAQGNPVTPPSSGGVSRAPASTVKFEDVSASAGVDFAHQNSKTPRKYLIETMGSGGAFIDYDGDGLLDVLLLNCRQLPGGKVQGAPGLKLFHNSGGGRFQDVTGASGLPGKPMYMMGVAVGDYDNDGRDDVYITGVLDPSRLYRNVGGKFQDVTSSAGVANAGRWGTSAAWVDYDKDGKLDLFVCNYVKYASLKDDQPCYSGSKLVYCIPSAYDKSTCSLYKNLGGGRFKDVTGPTGVGNAFGKSLGVTVWDYDKDGWPDIFVANDTVPGFLLHNLNGKSFEELGVVTGVALSEEGNPHSGMGIDADDANNDGSSSLVITNYYGQETSFYDQPSPTYFRDDRTQAGVGKPTSTVLGFGIMWLDYDNDGWKDILQVNGHVQDDIQDREPGTPYAEPTLLFRNMGNGKYVEVGLGAGEPFTKKIVGRGCAWGDFDNDGRVDALITNNNGRCMLWRNGTETANHWLTLKLVGTKSNRSGIGALITVVAGGVKQRTLVRSGSSYLCASDLRPHFGLGAAQQASVEIVWPSGQIDRIESVPVDGISVVREGSGKAEPLPRIAR
jgi:enediyne biosynthesis protein E4